MSVPTRTVRDVRASRLVAELLVLQRRGRATAADLAAELECSERTVYRDMQAAKRVQELLRETLAS